MPNNATLQSAHTLKPGYTQLSRLQCKHQNAKKWGPQGCTSKPNHKIYKSYPLTIISPPCSLQTFIQPKLNQLVS
uniref:Putative ovule protein n=1 Tax=Solanum chacoense TaxID=4108 RepID=A0A0V0I1M3_SOLCH